MATLLEKTRQVNELLQKNNLFDVQAEVPYNKCNDFRGYFRK